jgi:hypothetical protein
VSRLLMDSTSLALGREIWGEISMITFLEILWFVIPALEVSNSSEIREHFLHLIKSISKSDRNGGKWFSGNIGTHYFVCAREKMAMCWDSKQWRTRYHGLWLGDLCWDILPFALWNNLREIYPNHRAAEGKVMQNLKYVLKNMKSLFFSN